MEFINHTKVRRSKFIKRTKAIKQKIQDLVTLCDIEAAMICYGMDGELQTWPPQQEKLMETLQRYKKVPKAKRNKDIMVLDSSSDRTQDDPVPMAASMPPPATATATVAVAVEDNVQKPRNVLFFSSEGLLRMEKLFRKRQDETCKRIDLIKNQTIEVSSDEDSSMDEDEVSSDDDDHADDDSGTDDEQDCEVDIASNQVDAAVGNQMLHIQNRTQLPYVHHQQQQQQQQFVQVIRPIPTRITFPPQIAAQHNFISGF